jgi:hypothetical protein
MIGAVNTVVPRTSRGTTADSLTIFLSGFLQFIAARGQIFPETIDGVATR